MAEEQAARVRDRVYAAMTPDRDMGELSSDTLRCDGLWLEARDGYRTVSGDLLRTMPPPVWRERPVRLSQLRATAPLHPAVPAPPSAGTASHAR